MNKQTSELPWRRQKRISHHILSFIALAVLLAAIPLITACNILNGEHQHKASTNDYPFISEIWDTRAQQLVTRETLLRRAAEANYVLLGEMHDNKDHHRIQSDMLKALIAKGIRPVLAMEQF